MLCREGLETGELRHGPDLWGMLPVCQLGQFFAADTGDEALVGIPSCRKSGIRESFGLRRDNRTVEGFGPSAVRPDEDLLVDLPCWLGDVRPPFSEPGILQIVVHFVFVLQKYSVRSGLKSAKEHRGWPMPP